MIGYCMCGSFCTISKSLSVLKTLVAEGNEIVPIFSEAVYSTNTRFGSAEERLRTVSALCRKEILHTVAETEPIGPIMPLDLLVVAPCTGNTLAKMAQGITDGPVTMAVKAQLRSGRPVVLALATNDALSANLKNIGTMLSRKNVYFVPMSQDDPEKKPSSLVCDFSRLKETMLKALQGQQLQPVFSGK